MNTQPKNVRIYLCSSSSGPFVKMDAKLLREHFTVDWMVVGDFRRVFLSLFEIVKSIIKSDLLILWYGELQASIGALVSRALGKPALLILAGFEISSLPEYGYGSQRNILHRTLVSVAVSAATMVVVPSRYLSNQGKSLFPRTDFRIAPLAVDSQTVFEEGKGYRAGVLTIVAGSRDLRVKGIDRVVETARRLPDLQFTILGTDVQSVRKISGQFPPNLRAVPWVPHDQVGEYCRSATVIFQPSRDESFGLAVAEGMACGCIAVTSAAGGLPEVVGGEGVVVKEPNPDQLADAIQQAIAKRHAFDPARRIRETFDPARRARILVDLVNEMTVNAEP